MPLIRDELIFLILASIGLITVFWFQQFVIYPIESTLLQSSLVDIASLMFLPHGVKVLMVLSAGYRALLPIWIASYLGFVPFFNSWTSPLWMASIGTLAIAIPLWATSTQIWGRWLGTPGQTNLFYQFILLGLATSVLNSTFMALFNSNLLTEGINLRFLIGDLVGTCAVFGIFVLARKPILRALVTRISRNRAN